MQSKFQGNYNFPTNVIANNLQNTKIQILKRQFSKSYIDKYKLGILIDGTV